MKLNNIFFLLIFFTGLNLHAQDSPFVKQDEAGLLPVFKENFRPQISIAPQLAFISFNDFDSKGLAYGVEFALQCPLACTRKNYIRQQISFLYYSNDEDNLNYWTVSINPEYRLVVKPSFELAVGPSVGYFSNKLNAELSEDELKSSGINYGISTSATIHMGNLLIGLSPRYILSKDLNVLGTDFSQNNFQGVLKLGLKF